MKANSDISAIAFQNAHAERARIVEEMQRHYPGHRLQDIGEIVYRSSRTSPDEIKAAGGFIPVNKQVRLGTALQSPNNEGLVDFSFVPEIATIFAAHKTHDRYIYATPADKGYLMQGQWRQVAVPALPLPEFVVARKIESRDGVHIFLGEPEIIGRLSSHAANDATLQRFLTTKALAIPQDIGLGDEHSPPFYDIKDTPTSMRFFSSHER